MVKWLCLYACQAPGHIFQTAGQSCRKCNEANYVAVDEYSVWEDGALRAPLRQLALEDKWTAASLSTKLHTTALELAATWTPQEAHVKNNVIISI